MGLKVSTVYQIYTVLMFVSCLANLAAVRPRRAPIGISHAAAGAHEHAGSIERVPHVQR